MLAAVDLDIIATHLVNAAAEVRLVPVQGENAEFAGEHVTTFLKQLANRRDTFRGLVSEASEGARAICDADQFFTEEERAGIRRIERLFREWAPRFAALRVPEGDPLVLSFPAWFRSYNDALTTLVRSLLDSARALATRLADEDAEDVEAAQWAERRQPSVNDEELVSWADVRSELYPNGH